MPEILTRTNVEPTYEAGKEEWGNELTTLVRANEGVIVSCPWLNGAEVMLSVAMNSYSFPPNLTAEDEPFLISVVQELLANRVIKSEEEEAKTEEEELFKTEEADSKEQLDKTTVDADWQSEKETQVSKQLELPEALPENSQASGSGTTAATAGVTTSPVRNESKRSDQKAAKAKGPDSSDGSAGVSSTDNLGAAETPGHKGGTAGNPGEETSIDETIPPPAKPQLVDQGPASPKVPKEAIMVTAESELTELSDSASQLASEEAEVVEDPPIYPTIEYEEYSHLADFIEGEELLIDYLDDTVPHVDENFVAPAPDDIENGLNPEEALIYRLSDELNLPGQIENTSPEQSTEISLPPEEIENSLIQLAEVIEASEPTVTEKANEILDKIIEVPAKVAPQKSEKFTEAEAQAELEELFTQLFDELGIDYTPELIESLAYLTLRLHLVEEIAELKEGEEKNEAPQGSGTHEIIKKLLAGISNLKKSIANTYAIGKSAIRLYNLRYLTC